MQAHDSTPMAEDAGPSPTAAGPAAGKVRTYWAPVTMLVLGIVSVALIAWISSISQRQAVQALVVDDAIRQLEVAVSTSHLWLEELLTGDPSIDAETIWQDLDRSIELVFLVLKGGSTEPGSVEIEPLRDPRLRRQAEEVRSRLERLRQVSMERYRASAGVGSDMDQDFDQIFLDLLKDSETLRAALAERRQRLHVRSQLHLRLVVAAWLVLVSAAAAGLWNGERQRRQAEQALREREAELQQAQKMEAVGRLAGGIAHDINNYLGAIRGYCEVALLKSGSNAEVTQQQMRAAMETASEASALIRRLLAFSRRQPTRREVVDVNQVVNRMESLMRQLIGDNVQLSTESARGALPIEIDMSQVEQVLVNLLVNSRDAMPRGGSIVVTTDLVEGGSDADSAGPSLPPGRYVRLAVRDTGNGIAPEIREKIFEPFFTTKAAEGSSGLGLATVYGIVQQSGGVIALESEAGKGTTLSIFWPASDKTPTAPEQETAAAPAASEVTRILLVDDNVHMRTSTEALLEALGHQVVTASDGQEALELLAAADRSFDLVITDVVMPDMSGPELLAKIRQQGRRGVGGIFISGYTDTSILGYAGSVIQGSGLDQENTEFLQKPFTAHHLSHKIRKVVRRGVKKSDTEDL